MKIEVMKKKSHQKIEVMKKKSTSACTKKVLHQ